MMNKWVSGKVSVETLLAFVFGVVFVLLLLFLQPQQGQEENFRIVMSLAAAGVTAVMPGTLNVSAIGGKRFRLRAAGKRTTAGYVAIASTSQARGTSCTTEWIS